MGKVKSLMPTNLRVMGVLRIVGVKRNRGLADRFFLSTFKNFQERSATRQGIQLLNFNTNVSRLSHALQLGFTDKCIEK